MYRRVNEVEYVDFGDLADIGLRVDVEDAAYSSVLLVSTCDEGERHWHIGRLSSLPDQFPRQWAR